MSANVNLGYSITVSKLLFPLITKEIERLRNDSTNLRRDLPTSKIQDIIKKEMNLNISINYDNSSDVNAYIAQPLLNEDHPFLKQYNSAFASGDGIALIKKATGVIYGGFDKSGKAFGIFSEIHTNMGITRGALENKKYTSANIAAIICHEIGHYHTALRSLKYCVTTAFLLRSCVESFFDTSNREERTKLVLAYENAIGTTIQDREKLVDSNDKELVTTVIVGAAGSIDSELRTDAYDVSACEQAADQFAVACGAHADLVSALDKIHWYWTPSRIPRPLYYLWEITRVSSILAGAMSSPFYAAFLTTTVLLRGNPLALHYNKTEERLTRIRNAAVVETKATWLTKEQREHLHSAIKEMDNTIKNHKDRPKLFELFFVTLTPKGARDKRNTDLVRAYERMVANDIHVGVNRLKSL